MINTVWCRHQLTLNHVSKYITMSMTALQWSSLIEYMETVPCWTNRAYVCIALCVRLNLNILFLAFEPVKILCYEVVVSPSCVVQIHYIIMMIMALHRSSLVGCMKRVLCWPWMNSAYVVLLCACACIRLCYQWLLHYEVAILPSCAILLSDGNGGSSSTFVCWIYGPTGVVLAVNQQLVCFHCCVC